jgi:hypothetical protein
MTNQKLLSPQKRQGSLRLLYKLTRVHDVVSADGTVINVDIYEKVLFKIFLPQAQRATAFHFLTSKRFYTAPSIIMNVNLLNYTNH